MYQSSVVNLWIRQQYSGFGDGGRVEDAWCGQLEQLSAGRIYGDFDARSNQTTLPREQDHLNLANLITGEAISTELVQGTVAVYDRSDRSRGDDVADIYRSRVCGGLAGAESSCDAVDDAVRDPFESPQPDTFATLLLFLSAIAYFILFAFVGGISIVAGLFAVVLVFLLPATLTLLALPSRASGATTFNRHGVRLLRATVGLLVFSGLGQFFLTLAVIILTVLDAVFKGLF